MGCSVKILELPVPKHGQLEQVEAYYARMGVAVGWRSPDPRKPRKCKECKKAYDASQFRATSVTFRKTVSRAKVCLRCEAKPTSQRPMTCRVCHRRTTREQAPKGTCRACRQALRPKHTTLPKRCRECLRTLPSEAFTVNPSGYRKFRCKECIERQLAPGGKNCPYCHEFKPFEAYSIHRRATDGRKTVCRACENLLAPEPPWATSAPSRPSRA